MKRISLLLALLVALTILLVTAGCNDGATLSDLTVPPASPSGEMERIGVKVQNASTTPPTYDTNGLSYSSYANAWTTSVPAPERSCTLKFYRMVTGSKGGLAPRWDYKIFRSSVAQDYNNPVQDLANFNQLVVSLPAYEDATKPVIELTQDYTFWDNSSRVLIRAYEPGTKTQTDTTFVSVSVATPQPNIRTDMSVVDSVDANGAPIQTATINLYNIGSADANDVTLKLGSSSLPDTIEASTSWEYGQSDSGPVAIKTDYVYALGKSISAINGEIGPCKDNLVTGGLELGTLESGKTITVYAIYRIDPNAPGLGFSR